MAKFCRACGAALQEGQSVCPNCGTDLEVRQQTPAAEAPKDQSIDWKALWATVVEKTKLVCGKIADGVKVLCGKIGEAVQNADWDNIGGVYSQLIRVFALVVAVLSLVLFVLHTFSTYDVQLTASYGGESLSESGPIRELYEADEFIGVLIVNILYGIACLVLALVGAAAFVCKMDLNQQIGFLRKADGDALYKKLCLSGVITTVVFMILFAIVGSGESWGVKYSLSVHWTNWISLVLYVLLTVANFVLLKKQEAPALEEPAAEASVSE